MWFYVALFYPPPRLTIPMTLVRCGRRLVAWQLVAAGAQKQLATVGVLQLGVTSSPRQCLPPPAAAAGHGWHHSGTSHRRPPGSRLPGAGGE
jgi:hypothetical protein